MLKWPNLLPDRPVIGDLIVSASSTRTKEISLQVVRCVWKQSEYEKSQYSRDGWYLEVELHLSKFQQEMFGIEKFENWVLDNN